jgi:hypothetical protein
MAAQRPDAHDKPVKYGGTHPFKFDCTHYSMPGGVIDVMVHLLYSLLLAHPTNPLLGNGI